MAPTPIDDDNNLLADPTSSPKPDEGYWTKGKYLVTSLEY